MDHRPNGSCPQPSGPGGPHSLRPRWRRLPVRVGLLVMAKRFGRNQKRRMRRELAEAQQEAVNAHLNRLEAENRGARNQAIVDMTADVLGRYFISLAPETLEVNRLSTLAEGWKTSAWMRTPDYNPSLGMDRVINSKDEFVCRVLPVLRGSPIQIDLQNKVHAKFTYQGRHVGYSIDLDDLLLMPKWAAAQRLAKSMADHLLEELEKTHGNE